MTKLRMFAVAAVVLGMLGSDAQAQRRGGGGAVSTGVRGAMVGGLVGGEGGAAKGAKVGAVVGATRTVVQSAEQRNAVNTEAQTRTQYQATTEYQGAPHSDFNAVPPEVLATSASGASAAPSATAPTKGDQPVETIIRKGGKPAVGITYPANWKLKAADHHVTAVTADGNGWSVIALLDGVKDKEAGIAKAKEGLDKSFKDVKYDEATETERGALVVTGTGKGKKSGAEVVFAVGIFESGADQLAGAVFIVDKNVEDHYKETVRYICGTIRGEKDFAETKDAGK